MKSKVGEVTVYTGTMFGGKTSKLIDKMVGAGESSICFKPLLDNRAGDNVIKTHDGVELPVTSVKSASEILFLLEPTIKVVGIDEASLFYDDPTLIPTIEVLRDTGRDVYIAGLDRTFEDKPFGQMGSIMVMADVVKKLRAKCSCGELASVSTLKANVNTDSKEDLIGGEDKYEPMCRTCFYKTQR